MLQESSISLQQQWEGKTCFRQEETFSRSRVSEGPVTCWEKEEREEGKENKSIVRQDKTQSQGDRRQKMKYIEWCSQCITGCPAAVWTYNNTTKGSESSDLLLMLYLSVCLLNPNRKKLKAFEFQKLEKLQVLCQMLLTYDRAWSYEITTPKPAYKTEGFTEGVTAMRPNFKADRHGWNCLSGKFLFLETQTGNNILS